MAQILPTTFYYFIGSLGLEFLVGLGVALLVYSYTGRLRGVVRTLILLPLAMSPVVVALMWMLMFDLNYGPINYFLGLLGVPAQNWLGNTSLSLPSLIITNAWEFSPFIFLVVYAGLQMIPVELHEAANVDGLGRFQTFRYVTLPSIRASIVVALTLDAIGVLKGFDLVYVLTNGGPGYSTSVLSFYIYEVGFSFLQAHYAAALSLLYLAIIIAFVAAVIKFTSLEDYLGLKKMVEK